MGFNKQTHTLFIPIMVTSEYIIMYLKLNLRCVLWYNLMKVCYSLETVHVLIKTLNYVDFSSHMIVKDHATHYFNIERQGVTRLNSQKIISFYLLINLQLIESCNYFNTNEH